MGKFNELRVVIYLKLKKVAKIEIVVFIASIITDKYCRDNSSMVHTIIITVTKTDHQEYSTTKTTTIVDINREDTTAINVIIRNLQATTDKTSEHSTIAASEENTDYSTKTTSYIKYNGNKI
ncbi:hypothetical protein BpHYR1_018393 [Brachionus plicatilis]|uniref:Uncharacterized protein n=1 Tax=Brachionus plicatilis TaxID=10195 RepID=A0A3M7P6G3_BRAPC|nr:hypothetical protein BpHYR1_018393 [Brachionus plicatilis]